MYKRNSKKKQASKDVPARYRSGIARDLKKPAEKLKEFWRKDIRKRAVDNKPAKNASKFRKQH